MKIFDRFFRQTKRDAQRPDISSLREQTASDIEMFTAIRGRGSLLKPGTAVVMSHHYQTFVTKDISRIADREGILAVVYIKDVESYEQLRRFQTDDLRGTAGAVVLNSLAGQVAKELLRQAAQVGPPAV
jgi:nitrogen-specific signal transduction histidine kinase